MKTTIIEPHKSSLGMDANFASLIIYISIAALSWIPYIQYVAWAAPLVFFFMEKNSKFVKYQAIQALIVGIIWAVIDIIFSIIMWAMIPRSYNLYGLINFSSRWAAFNVVRIIFLIIELAFTVLVVYFVIMVYQWKQVELPVIGPMVNSISEKLGSAGTTGTAQPDAPAGTDKPKFCGNCGAKNASGTKFCGKCGKPMA